VELTDGVFTLPELSGELCSCGRGYCFNRSATRMFFVAAEENFCIVNRRQHKHQHTAGGPEDEEHFKRPNANRQQDVENVFHSSRTSNST
jgi:hypothetical protein